VDMLLTSITIGKLLMVERYTGMKMNTG